MTSCGRREAKASRSAAQPLSARLVVSIHCPSFGYLAQPGTSHCMLRCRSRTFSTTKPSLSGVLTCEVEEQDRSHPWPWQSWRRDLTMTKIQPRLQPKTAGCPGETRLAWETLPARDSKRERSERFQTTSRTSREQ